MGNDDATSAGLGTLGLSEGEVKLYECLLRSGGGSVKETARAANMSANRAERLLDALEALGVVNRSVGDAQRFVPVPPEDVVDSLSLRRERELLQARRSAMRFLENVVEPAEWRPKRDFLQVIVGVEAARERFDRMILGAKKDLWALNTGPMSGASDEWTKAKIDLLRGGVRGRVVYDLESLQSPGVLTLVKRLAFGEEARTLPTLPLPLAIVDRRAAFLPLTPERPGPDTEILVVYESALLDLLILMFEAVWERAAPFDTRSGQAGEPAGQEISDDDRMMLTLLGAGMKETAIARQSGISPRTLERRLSAITERLGTATRFHTAVEACRRGWITTG